MPDEPTPPVPEAAPAEDPTSRILRALAELAAAGKADEALAALDAGTRAVIKQQIHTEAWFRGDLKYKLHATQRRIYDAFFSSSGRKYYLLCSRRLGKTYLLLTIAFEIAISKPGSRILFLAPTGKQAAEIASDTAAQILSDCPPHLLPKHNIQQKEFIFERPHGRSIIRLKGVNSEHADDIRGTGAELIILDECGKMDGLESVVSSICMPMTMTTNGRILLATTPPESPGHDSARIYETLAGEGAAAKFTIRDAPPQHISEDRKAEFLREAGEKKERLADILAGTARPETTAALREYFCEFVTDASKAVVPEFLEYKSKVVQSRTRPAQSDTYVAVDPGFNDKTGILYGYYDFREGEVVIQGEDLLTRASTNMIAEAVLKKEWELWQNEKPYMRVVDDDLRLTADLRQLHGLHFSPAQKQDALKGVNLIRSMITDGVLIIDPVCVNLIRQIESATWNTRATDFARVSENVDSVLGHFDLLAALKYLVRSVNRHRNVRRPGLMTVSADGFRTPRRRFWSPGPGQSPQLDLLSDTPAGKRLKGK